MKKLIVSIFSALSVITLLTGCVGWSGGSDSTTIQQIPTVGQQLIDLQKARNAGAISDSEYETEKARLLGQK